MTKEEILRQELAEFVSGANLEIAISPRVKVIIPITTFIEFFGDVLQLESIDIVEKLEKMKDKKHRKWFVKRQKPGFNEVLNKMILHIQEKRKLREMEEKEHADIR